MDDRSQISIYSDFCRSVQQTRGLDDEPSSPRRRHSSEECSLQLNLVSDPTAEEGNESRQCGRETRRNTNQNEDTFDKILAIYNIIEAHLYE